MQISLLWRRLKTTRTIQYCKIENVTVLHLCKNNNLESCVHNEMTGMYLNVVFLFSIFFKKSFSPQNFSSRFCPLHVWILCQWFCWKSFFLLTCVSKREMTIVNHFLCWAFSIWILWKVSSLAFWNVKFSPFPYARQDNIGIMLLSTFFLPFVMTQLINFRHCSFCLVLFIK